MGVHDTNEVKLGLFNEALLKGLGYDYRGFLVVKGRCPRGAFALKQIGVKGRPLINYSNYDNFERKLNAFIRAFELGKGSA